MKAYTLLETKDAKTCSSYKIVSRKKIVKILFAIGLHCFIVREAEFIPDLSVAGHYVCSLLSDESFYGCSALEVTSHATRTNLKA